MDGRDEFVFFFERGMEKGKGGFTGDTYLYLHTLGTYLRNLGLSGWMGCSILQYVGRVGRQSGFG